MYRSWGSWGRPGRPWNRLCSSWLPGGGAALCTALHTHKAQCVGLSGVLTLQQVVAQGRGCPLHGSAPPHRVHSLDAQWDEPSCRSSGHVVTRKAYTDESLVHASGAPYTEEGSLGRPPVRLAVCTPLAQRLH